MAAVCVEETRAVLLWHAVSEPYAWPESGTRVVVGWWDRRCAREGLGNYRYICGITSTYVFRGIHVVLELLHAVHGESVGSDTRVAAHARGGMYETRERSQRAESDRCVEKYRCILRICASRRAISRLYMYTRSGGGTRGSGGFAARCEKVTVLVVARRRNFDRRG